MTATYTRNVAGEITDLSNTLSGQTTALSDFGSMAYDGVGNRTSVTASLPGAPSTYSGTTSYGYDTKNELTQETRTGSGTGNYSNAFSYDSAENPQVFRSQPAAGSNAFSADNQTTAFTGSSGSSVGSFGYDGDGNPTTYKGTTLTFDPENRMTAYGTAMTAGYGPDDLRAWKQSSSGATYFLYNKMNQPVCEFNSSGTLTATNTYGHAGLVSRRASNTSTFYTFDPQGSVTQRLNASGGIVSSDTGDAFGSRATTGGGNVFGYIGQWGYYTDSETGLCLCQHRYYDPATGRFVTRDPTGYQGSINLYNYCQNNSVNAADPTGFGGIIEELLEGFASCEALALGDLSGRKDVSVCADAGACTGALFVSLANIAGEYLVVTDPPGFECLANAAGQLIATAVTAICNSQTDPCPPPVNFCQFVSALGQALAGCVEGALGAVLGGSDVLWHRVLAQVGDTILDTAISSFGGSQDAKCTGG